MKKIFFSTIFFLGFIGFFEKKPNTLSPFVKLILRLPLSHESAFKAFATKLSKTSY